ncbi:hypothetical protein SARC_10172 [Sphaeroforma arctica JP610]|uniref:Uncharacterized protein n=1 Tax=Sphaeroforma arctica JP610 TaxID=667725 RepID=A0A0L0FKQ4_9EUKA|nr:hypothetical protein SARC_10172 [Sphaeroforma arctica JP610]KNC77367.1 hypothetical protein SARC_10172 [Sphaeroforma arctica JP610]|eukprot:XP_014151269.1 hypothetical protein SARC_10172 [Sphaeroforma arctica JP610]
MSIMVRPSAGVSPVALTQTINGSYLRKILYNTTRNGTRRTLASRRSDISRTNTLYTPHTPSSVSKLLNKHINAHTSTRYSDAGGKYNYGTIPVRLCHTARMAEDSSGDEATYSERDASTDKEKARVRFVNYKLPPGNNVVRSKSPVREGLGVKVEEKAGKSGGVVPEEESANGKIDESGGLSSESGTVIPAAEFTGEHILNECTIRRGPAKNTMEVNFQDDDNAGEVVDTQIDVEAFLDVSTGWKPPILTEEQLEVKEAATREFQQNKYNSDATPFWPSIVRRNEEVRRKIQERSPEAFIDLMTSKDLYRTTKRRGNGFHEYDDYNLLVALQEYEYEDDVNWKAVTKYVAALSTHGIITRKLVHRRWYLTLDPDLKHGGWDDHDDERLKQAVEQVTSELGTVNWSAVQMVMKDRSLKQCRERWTGSLNPDILRGGFTKEEDMLLADLVKQEEMRPEHLKQGKRFWTETGKRLVGRTYLQCKNRWVRSLDPTLNMGPWTEEETNKLRDLHSKHDGSWVLIAEELEGRSPRGCEAQWVTRAGPEVTAGLKMWSEEDIMKLALSVAKHKAILRHTWGSVAKTAGLMRAHHVCRGMWVAVSNSLTLDHNYDSSILDINVKIDASELPKVSEMYQEAVKKYLLSLKLRKGVDKVTQLVEDEDRKQTQEVKQAERKQLQAVVNAVSSLQREVRNISARNAEQTALSEGAVAAIIRLKKAHHEASVRKATGPKKSRTGAFSTKASAAQTKKLKLERERNEYQLRSLTEKYNVAEADTDHDQMFYYSYARAMVHEKLRDLDAALVDYKTASALRNEDARPFLSMALIYMEMYKQDEAFECINEGFSRDPDRETEESLKTVIMNWIEEGALAEEDP